MAEINCSSFGVKPGSFPCDADPIEAISIGIATGGVALLFSMFLVGNVGSSTHLEASGM